MDQAMTKGILQAILGGIKRDSFVDGYKATDSEAMGLLLSRYFEWDAIEILKAAEAALEDANFHTECAKLGDIRAELESPAQPASRTFRVPSHSRRGVSYQVTLGPDGNTCECGDFIYRHNDSCKHILDALAGRLVLVG